MKKHGHYCHVCGRHRANEKFSGKGHAKHICKDCNRDHRAKIRARKKEFDSRIVFIQVVARPERKLIVKRAVIAEDYFAYCAEVGCDVWDELKAIPGTLGEPIGLWMPPAMKPVNTSLYVQGVEVSVQYSGHVPEGFDIITLPPGWIMIFQGLPYDDAQFSNAIGVVQAAIKKFDPHLYGYEWVDEEAPRVQWEPIGKRGYIEGRPVRPGVNLGIMHMV